MEILYILFCLFLTKEIYCQNCEIFLSIKNTTSSGIYLGWSTSSSCGSNSLFKIYFEHVEWKSCTPTRKDESRGRGRGNFETVSSSIFISPLHSYSIYKLTVKIIPSNVGISPVEKIMYGETKSGSCSLTPQVSGMVLTAKSLKFTMKNPSNTDCDKWNGISNGFAYWLTGLSPWNSDFEFHNITSFTSILIKNLIPFSDYSLSLVHLLKDVTPILNDSFAQRMNVSTKADTPFSPKNLEILSVTENIIHLGWNSAIPPNGELDYVLFRWKMSEGSEWTDTLRVSNSVLSSLCSNNKSLCYSIKEINTEQNTTFQIASHNKGVERDSEWSKEAHYIHQVSNSDSEKENFSIFHIFITVIIALSGILLLLLLLHYKWRKISNKYIGVFSPGYSRQSQRPIIKNSIQDIPLPSLPNEHFYEELPCKSTEEDNDFYLKPKEKNGSSNSLDPDDYLKPNSYPDPRNLTAPNHNPPPIPFNLNT